MSNKKIEASKELPLEATLNEKKEVVESVEVKDVHSVIDVINVSIRSSNSVDVGVYDNCVKFKVKYSKDYKGVKRYKDGDVLNISEESAEIFKNAGIGSIL